jgi:hypothetical protein
MFHKKEWQILLCKTNHSDSTKKISETDIINNVVYMATLCHNLIKRNKMANCFNQCDRDKIYFKR